LRFRRSPTGDLPGTHGSAFQTRTDRLHPHAERWHWPARLHGSAHETAATPAPTGEASVPVPGIHATAAPSWPCIRLNTIPIRKYSAALRTAKRRPSKVELTKMRKVRLLPVLKPAHSENRLRAALLRGKVKQCSHQLLRRPQQTLNPWPCTPSDAQDCHYSIYSVKGGFESLTRRISELGCLVSTPWTQKSFISNRRVISQAGRRGFASRLQLLVFTILQILGSAMNLLFEVRRQRQVRNLLTA
jgi:hypothetical protein